MAASMRVGIYEIANLVNGKRYIGSTVGFADRFGTHRRALNAGLHHSSHLQRSWNKHGKWAFVFRRLLICDRATLLFYEQLCIDAMKPAYNVSQTAGSRLGIRNTPEHNAKIGAAHRGKKRGPLSAETKAKLREIGLRANRPPPRMSPEVRALVNAKKLGVKQSAEHIAKRVVKLKALMLDPERKAKAATVLLVHSEKRKTMAAIAMRTDEARLAASERMRKKWQDPEFRARVSAASKAAQTGDWKLKQAAGVSRVQADPEFHKRRNEGRRAALLVREESR